MKRLDACGARRATSAALLLAAVCVAGPTARADGDCEWFPDFDDECEREARPAGSVMPMSFPYIFEDPYITSGLNFVGIWHQFPGGSALGNGQLGVLALQARVAVTDRLALIATKDGISFLDQNNPAVKDDTGLFNITFGAKYAAWKWQGENSSAIFTPHLRYEISSGMRAIFQDHDDGMFIIGATGAYQHEGWHAIVGIGGHAPVDTDKNSSNFFYNFHVDHAFPLEEWRVTYIVPFIELNGISWTGSGKGTRNLPLKGPNAPIGAVAPGFEGVDVINLGNKGVSGNNYVTMAWGIRVPLDMGVDVGFAYERPLSNNKEITEQRITTMVTWEF